MFISGIFQSIIKLLIPNALQCLDMLMIALILGETTFYICLSMNVTRCETRFSQKIFFCFVFFFHKVLNKIGDCLSKSGKLLLNYSPKNKVGPSPHVR